MGWFDFECGVLCVGFVVDYLGLVWGFCFVVDGFVVVLGFVLWVVFVGDLLWCLWVFCGLSLGWC